MFIGKSTDSDGDSLNAYLRDISDIHPLSKAEERHLADTGDDESLRKLVERNLKYVVMVANHYKGMGISLPDLINEGNVGMMQAALRFRPDKNVKFITYAVWWVRQSIFRALAEQASVVRLPIKQAGLLSKISKAVEQLRHALSREPVLEEVAEKLMMKPVSLERVMRVYRGYMSLDSPLNDERGTLFIDMLEADPEHSVEEDYFRLCLHHDIKKLMHKLPERQEAVLRMRYGFDEPPMTLAGIGKRLGLTRERVRQIEKSAKNKLRSAMSLTHLEDFLR